MGARNGRSPAAHRVFLGGGVVAGRPPRNFSVRGPPRGAASPPPCPACSSTAMVRISASSSRTNFKRVNMPRGKYLARAGPHKRGPVRRVERRAAHQHTVELRLGQQRRGVLEVHTAPVENPRGGDPTVRPPAADSLMAHGRLLPPR